MDETYGATKGPWRFSGRVGTIELDDFIQDFECWCDQQSLKNPKGFSPFMAWKVLFSHLEGAPMDDWREFSRQYPADIEAWRAHYSPDYVSLTLGGSVTPSGTQTYQTPRVRQQAVGTSGGSGGITQTAVVAPTFNPIVEFFKVLAKSY